MSRKLFCELHPYAYKISWFKETLKRYFVDLLSNNKFSKIKSQEKLSIIIKTHKSLIRRKLGNAELQLQENKAKNLELATPKVTGILIKPGETFSFWHLVGHCTKRKGYLEGLNIKKHAPTRGTAGGMCQFTNLLHWLVLHSDLDIVEHHHHNEFDLFPDYNRTIPFGTGTSIVYNYLDYRFKNNTDNIYQIIVWTDEEYLNGELRAEKSIEIKPHIIETESYFYEKNEKFYRHNKIFRKLIDKRTGAILSEYLLLENNALVCYDSDLIDKERIRK
ncbi:hypothetical protein FACS1894122_10610 [Alphaproteobacteria bacterium]|nr:hypothetical protein FACS1894122_10610 [Alphaproteobacteria bacterium]